MEHSRQRTKQRYTITGRGVECWAVVNVMADFDTLSKNKKIITCGDSNTVNRKCLPINSSTVASPHRCVESATVPFAHRI